MYVEGIRKKVQPDFITELEFKKLEEEGEHEECMSAGDFKEDFEQKIKFLDDRDAPKYGFFENNTYFDKIFPRLKI